MNGFLQRFRRDLAAAVSVEWVVLSALAVTLLAAGFGDMKAGALSVASSTASYMESYR